MKTIGLFIPLMLILAACSPSQNAVDIAQAQSVIEAARAAQDAAYAAQIAARGISDIGRGQTLILVLLTLLLVLLVALAVFVVIRRLNNWQHGIRRIGSGKWLSGPNAHWKKTADEPDLYRQMLIEQQLLLTQLLSHGQEETDNHDLSELPMDWWS